MSEIVEKNRKCAKEVLGKFEYEEETIPDSPIIGACKEIDIKNGKVVRFYVICEPSYNLFKKWIPTPEISGEEVRERLDTLNRELTECIKRSSSPNLSREIN
jgi:hypothetical protein